MSATGGSPQTDTELDKRNQAASTSQFRPGRPAPTTGLGTGAATRNLAGLLI